MANYLQIFAAPDRHIDFLYDHPLTISAYLEGREPTPGELAPRRRSWMQRLMMRGKRSGPLPEGWPESEPEFMGPEVNHRNVDLYHLLLNGTSDFVSGSGSLFQTWLTAEGEHDAITLTDGSYAFVHDQLPDLLQLIERLDFAAAKSRFGAWLLTKGEAIGPDDESAQSFVDEFQVFANGVRAAIGRNDGLAWVTC